LTSIVINCRQLTSIATLQHRSHHSISFNLNNWKSSWICLNYVNFQKGVLTLGTQSPDPYNIAIPPQMESFKLRTNCHNPCIREVCIISIFEKKNGRSTFFFRRSSDRAVTTVSCRPTEICLDRDFGRPGRGWVPKLIMVLSWKWEKRNPNQTQDIQLKIWINKFWR
jgi:hypothetical protein